MLNEKEKEDVKNPKFKVGEEVICIIDGLRAYVILSFRACIVNLGKVVRVIPQENLCLDKTFGSVIEWDNKLPYTKGDIVRVIPTEKKVVTGTVVDSKWFYVVHFHKDGQIKVAFAEVLAKGNTKIFPFVPVNPLIIKQKDLPGQGKLFKGR